jgi:hypothetical protein
LDEEDVMKAWFALMLVGLMALASAGYAQDSGSPELDSAALASGKNFNFKGSVSGRASGPSSGACTGGNQGFSNQCPTGHICLCTTISGARFSGNVVGRGTANVFITVDSSAGFGVPVPNGSSPKCFPVVSEIDFIAKKDTQALVGTGAQCTAPNNVQFSGAYAIAGSNLFSNGYANFTAGLNNNGSFKLNFKGTAQSK